MAFKQKYRDSHPLRILLLLLVTMGSINLLEGCTEKEAYYPAPAEKLPVNAAQALADARNVTLYSLEPFVEDDSSNGFYKYKVLGKVELQESEAKKATSAFQEAIANGGKPGLCFEPRHAIRITTNNHIYDYLLCYSCMGMNVYKDEHLVAYITVSGLPDTLNALLTAHQIPLSRK